MAVAASVVLGLVGMNYHFVGDTIGGAFLGAWTGMYAARFFQVAPGVRVPGSSGPGAKPSSATVVEAPARQSHLDR
jgi:hypothetical protein